MSDLPLVDVNLTTLEGENIPEIVDGYFSCSSNHLTSLKFGPKEVSGNYFCACNQLTSLEFCATKIGYTLYSHENLITNLSGIHIHFKNGYINGALNIELNPLKSHLLGVILIPRLTGFFIGYKDVSGIFNKHLQSGRDVLECQEELIQNGFKEFAQL